MSNICCDKWGRGRGEQNSPGKFLRRSEYCRKQLVCNFNQTRSEAWQLHAVGNLDSKEVMSVQDILMLLFLLSPRGGGREKWRVNILFKKWDYYFFWIVCFLHIVGKSIPMKLWFNSWFRFHISVQTLNFCFVFYLRNFGFSPKEFFPQAFAISLFPSVNTSGIAKFSLICQVHLPHPRKPTLWSQNAAPFSPTPNYPQKLVRVMGYFSRIFQLLFRFAQFWHPRSNKNKKKTAQKSRNLFPQGEKEIKGIGPFPIEIRQVKHTVGIFLQNFEILFFT